MMEMTVQHIHIPVVHHQCAGAFRAMDLMTGKAVAAGDPVDIYPVFVYTLDTVHMKSYTPDITHISHHLHRQPISRFGIHMLHDDKCSIIFHHFRKFIQIDVSVTIERHHGAAVNPTELSKSRFDGKMFVRRDQYMARLSLL